MSGITPTDPSNVELLVPLLLKGIVPEKLVTTGRIDFDDVDIDGLGLESHGLPEER